MSECTIETTTERDSSQASLIALGIKLQALALFQPIHEQATIAQKRVKYGPTEKLYDGWIAVLAGAHGLVEINTTLRTAAALQAAFGREGCAEQTVVQETLSASTGENVEQMQQAMNEIYRRQSQGYTHDDQQSYQILDVDTSDLPCGKKAAFASKGYFAKQHNRRGRQLERVLAGTTQLATAFQPLLEAAEQTLALTEAKRKRTIVRLDAGGGSGADVNWALQRHYQIQCKDDSSVRADTLAQSVPTWFDDPKVPGRQVGWVTVETDLYLRPLKRIAVRCPQKNQPWSAGVLLATLLCQELLVLTARLAERITDEQALLLAYVYFYDQRGGGVETSLKGDKQGLGITKRNQKRFEAQQILAQLNPLAHNVLIWSRRWLAPHCPKLARLGILRLGRDLWHISARVTFDSSHRIVQITLNQRNPFAHGLLAALRVLLAALNLALNLGQT